MFFLLLFRFQQLDKFITNKQKHTEDWKIKLLEDNMTINKLLINNTTINKLLKNEIRIRNFDMINYMRKRKLINIGLSFLFNE